MLSYWLKLNRTAHKDFKQRYSQFDKGEIKWTQAHVLTTDPWSTEASKIPSNQGGIVKLKK